MGSPEVHGDLDQLVDVTSVSLSSLGIWSRFPPPPPLFFSFISHLSTHLKRVERLQCCSQLLRTIPHKPQISNFRGKSLFSVNLEEAGRRMLSDLDQLIVVIQVPMGSPEVRGDLDKLVDVTSVSMGSLGIWSRFPPLSPSHSSPTSQLTRREWKGCNAEVSCSKPFLWVQLILNLFLND